MRAIIILIVAAILGFFGYQYARQWQRLRATRFQPLTGDATEMADDAANDASVALDAADETAADLADRGDGRKRRR